MLKFSPKWPLAHIQAFSGIVIGYHLPELYLSTD